MEPTNYGLFFVMTMKTLALDLSTSTGYAVLHGSDPELATLGVYGTIQLPKIVLEYGVYPYCYMNAALSMAEQVMLKVREIDPDQIIIEEINLGFSRYSQRILEFIHFAIIQELAKLDKPVKYISSSIWRQALGLVMSKDDKKNNSKLSREKRKALDKGAKLDKKSIGIRGKVTKKHLAIRAMNERFDLKLKAKDDDIADAIALGLAALTNPVLCDGT